jgi:pilus assembly protein CpaE
MKIVVIASSTEMLGTIQKILVANTAGDQLIFLQRQQLDVRIDRIDLASTNILILDSEKISNSDLRLISTCTRENANPAVIYMSGPCSEDELINAIRSGVMEFIHVPVDGNELISAIERIRSRKYISVTQKPRGKIVSFISCKGGAGATFIATNLGFILSTEEHKKVLMIDLHLQFGDASFYLSDEPGLATLADIVTKEGLDSTVIATAAMQINENYFLLQAPDNEEDSLGIVARHLDNLLTIAAQDYDFVILDLPILVDALVMKSLDRSDCIFMVMQPTVPYMRAITKMINLFNKLGLDHKKIKLTLNRFSPSIDISISKIEEAIQEHIDFTIANDYIAVSKSVNLGKPIAALDSKNIICENLRSLVATLTDQEIKPKSTSFFKKLFR